MFDRFVKLVIAILLLSFIVQFIPYSAVADDEQECASSWTFLIYMSADDPGAPLDWMSDINEMEEGLLDQNLTVVSLIDSTDSGDSKAYLIARDAQKSPEIVSHEITPLPFLPEDGEANMGDPETLIGFAEFVLEDYYDGGRFAVILWGHGGGWYGVAKDRADALEPQEMIYALDTVNDMLGKKVDLIVFDACSMGAIEVLSPLSDVAQYAVSSEIPVPGYGLPYDAIFSSISINPTMSTENAGKAFAYEYVEFGALVSGTTTQATVFDLEKLANASVTFKRLLENSSQFIQITQSAFETVRNMSDEIDGGSSTIDLMSYFSNLLEFDELPRRLISSINSSLEEFSDAIVACRSFIDIADIDQYPSLSGISIFFPSDDPPSSYYENTSEISKKWSEFLHRFQEAKGSEIPNVNLNMTIAMEDHRFEDGLTDAAILQWEESSEIQIVEVDIYEEADSEPLFTEITDSSIEHIMIDYLDPACYEIFVYGRGSEGEYLSYDIFNPIKIMRRYSYTIEISDFIGAESVQLVMTDLQRQESSSFDISNNNIILSYDVPDPYDLGDKILLELIEDDKAIARGLIVIGEVDDAEILHATERELSTPVELLTAVLGTGLIMFSFIKLMRVGQEAGLSLRDLKCRKLSRFLSSLSKPR